MCKKSLLLTFLILLVFSVSSFAVGEKGSILFEYFYDIGSGTAITDLTGHANYPDNPSEGLFMTSFDGLLDTADNYGVRARGYIYPPQTGNYNFWIATDDAGELWLSTNDDPANLALIASVSGWVGHLDWTNGSGQGGDNQKSAAITLQAGQRYYIQALMKEGGGGDNIAVAWGGPGIGTGPVLIAGQYLSPAIRPQDYLAQLTIPADGAIITDTFAALQWSAGFGAVSHDVYVGTSYDDVLAGTGGTFRGNQTGKWFTIGMGSAGDPYPDGLQIGTTYYWRVDEVEADGVTKHTGNVWSFSLPYMIAYNPAPADDMCVVSTDDSLTWYPGWGAKAHFITIDTDYDTVANAPTGTGNMAGGTTYDEADLLPDTTYYWRVDEWISASEIRKGNVWTFRTAPEGLGEAIMERWDNISGTTVDLLKNDPRYPGNPDVTESVTQFLWDATDLSTYGARISGWLYAPMTGDYTFWIASDDSSELWLSTTEDPENASVVAYLSGWADLNNFTSSSTQHSTTISLVGGQRYYIEALWKEDGGGDHCHVAWEGPHNSARETIAGKYLAPFLPVKAYGGSPANTAAGAPQAPTLTWKPGIMAASHQLYFGTNEQAVANATTTSPEYKGSFALGQESYTPGALLWDTTYYWRVDEVNNLNPDSPWNGSVWSFTTADFLVIDDFEDYNNWAPYRVFETWSDGYSDDNNGSIAGYLNPDFDAGEAFVETSNVHGGRQSMPVYYGNNGKYSYVTRPLSGDLSNWTQHDLKTLSLWYAGHQATLGSFTEGPTGTYTMAGAGADIWGQADQFHYSYLRLNGTGSITAKVTALSGTSLNEWAKAGVMIRETLDANSVNAFMATAAAQGVSYQVRAEAGTDTTNEQVADATARPIWIKLVRDLSGNFTASYADDAGGSPGTWTALTAVNAQMATNVYIGLAVTSHTAGVPAEAAFSNVTTTGNVSGTWTHVDVGIQSNVAAPMFVSIQDGAGHSATVYNNDPDAALVTSWTAWGEYGQGIALSEFTGVNLNNVQSITLGLGNPGTSIGAGLMFYDDIRLVPSRCVPQLAKPALDFNNNCVVDMPDLEILTDNWLNTTPDMPETVWNGSWSHSDIGSVNPAGSFTIDGAGNFEISGAGADIWGNVDGFHYAYQTLSGDGQITININSVDETNVWAKAGVMIRDSLDPNSAHALMVVTPGSGASFQWREVIGETSNSLTAGGITAPVCLRIVRQGDTFTGYYSTDAGWVQQGSVEIPMTDPVNIGIAVTSHSDGSICVATGDRNCAEMVLFTDLNQDGITNFQDYASMLDSWLDEQLWP